MRLWGVSGVTVTGIRRVRRPWLNLGSGEGAMMGLSAATALLVMTSVSGKVAAHEPATPDIAVYGGTASGVIAAVAAAREGKSVLLIEPGKHLGGMVSVG